MKKIISYLLIVCMIIFNLPTPVQATTNEIDVIDYVISEKQIKKGDEFTFGIHLKNNSDSKMENVNIVVSDGSYFGKNGMVLKVADTIKSGENANAGGLELIYNGQTDTLLHATIYYVLDKDGMKINKSRIVHLDVDAIPGDIIDNEGDTTKYEPKLSIVNSSIPSGKAGGTVDVKVTVENSTSYAAKDISITPDLSNTPFEFVDLTSVKTISTLGPKKRTDIVFKLKINKNADEKTYGVKLNFKFKNDYKNPFTGEQDIFVKVTKDAANSELTLKNTTSANSVASGTDFNFQLQLSNTGKSNLKDIRVTLKNMSSAEIMNNGNNYTKVDSLSVGKSQNVRFSLNASSKLETGNYPVKVLVTYKDSNNNSYEVEQEYYVRVQKNHPNLVLSGVKSSKTTVGEGQGFTLTVPVKNTGKATLSNLKVAAIPANDSSIRPTNDYIQYVELKAGETKNLIFTYTLNKGATAGSKSIKISAESGEIKSEYEYSVYADIPEKDDAKANSSRPIIIIDKYIVEPKMVKAGEEFDMNLEFQNTHKSKTVENIKIMIKAIEKEGKESEDVFAPVDGSTTFYIDSISPKSTANISTRMFTIPDAKSKTYKLAVNIEYEYKEGNEIKSATVSDEVGVTVRQNSKFMASDISLPEINQVGMPIYLSLQISNTGKIDLANFTVELEGDFHTDSKKTFIGNVAPGASQSYDVEITPMTAGEQQGALIFSYEEPTGEVVTERREFTIMVEEPYMPPTDEEIPPIDGGMEDPLAQKNSKTKFIIIGAIVLVAVVGGVVVYKKRKKKKAMEEEDIDE